MGDRSIINEYLILSSATFASNIDNLTQHNVKIIINVAMEIKYALEGFQGERYHIELQDHMDEDIETYFGPFFTPLLSSKYCQGERHRASNSEFGPFVTISPLSISRGVIR